MDYHGLLIYIITWSEPGYKWVTILNHVEPCVRSFNLVWYVILISGFIVIHVDPPTSWVQKSPTGNGLMTFEDHAPKDWVYKPPFHHGTFTGSLLSLMARRKTCRSCSSWLNGLWVVPMEMGISINGGSPKWLVHNGKSHKNGWFRGTRVSGNPQVFTQYKGKPSSPDLMIPRIKLIFHKSFKPC